jgi:UMF1 family MFS transporter
MAILSPFLGAMADRGAARKRSLLVFTLLGAAATGALFFVMRGNWPIAALLYACGVIGSLGAAVFYDSLLIGVSDAGTVDILSARGFALGYLGGGILFLGNVITVLHPGWFGLESEAQAIRFSFLSVAVWWGIFTIPLMLHVPEPRSGATLSMFRAAREGVQRLRVTVSNIGKYRPVVLLLVAYWFYIDGVDTIVVMAVDYGKSIGFSTDSLITALLLVQFVGFPFSYLLGYLAQRWHPRPLILFCIAVYVVVTILGASMSVQPLHILGLEVSQFYFLAFLIGTVQGGVQALSRSLYARMIPPGESAQFFGFYNMLGRFATILGPVLMGTITLLTGSARAGILSIALLFIIGGTLLAFVREPARTASEGGTS